MRQIKIYWWKDSTKCLIGSLVEVPRSPIVFEWDKEFLQNNIELSPIKFKKESGLITCPFEPFNGLPGLFADSVPDGWGRILLKIALKKQGIDSTELSPLDAMAYIGDRAMGALSFEPSLKDTSDWAEGKISLSELEKGISPIIEGSPSTVIDAFLENGASPNGIRPKIILKEKDGVFYTSSSPVEGDEWIIKFKAEGDPKEISKIEYIYSLMAKKAGLEIPETRLFTSKGKSYFGVKRFDRVGKKRIHVHTLSGMLHIAPGNFAAGYDHYAKVAHHLSQDVREVEKVLRLAAFNVFSVNQDDHSKNVAFMMNSSGKWKISPAYDLTYYKTRFNEHKMTVLDSGSPQEKTLRDFGKSFGLTKTNEILEEVKDSLTKFKKLATEYDLGKTIQKTISDSIEEKLTIKKSRKSL